MNKKEKDYEDNFEDLYKRKLGKNQIGISPYNHYFLKNKNSDRFNLFVATPCTGLVRMEWAMARFGQIIPCNWGFKTGVSWMPNYAPMGYLVADAQNLIVKRFIEDGSCEWLFIVEQDNVLPSDCFLRLNEYMRSRKVPILSGLYFTKSRPAEPMVYRGRGNSYYTDWKIGDKVWVDAIPTGCILIHRSILELLWKESPEYKAGDQVTRRVFHTPEASWSDPQFGVNNSVGTSDIEFCSRIIMSKVFERTGWKDYANKEFPFLIDTNIFVGHITDDGTIFPHPSEKEYWSIAPNKRESYYTVKNFTQERQNGRKRKN